MPKYLLQIRSDDLATSPYWWVLYREGEEHPGERSRDSFRTALLAKMSGNKVLHELERQDRGASRKRSSETAS